MKAKAHITGEIPLLEVSGVKILGIKVTLEGDGELEELAAVFQLLRNEVEADKKEKIRTHVPEDDSAWFRLVEVD